MNKVNKISTILNLEKHFPDINYDLIKLAISPQIVDKALLRRLKLLVKYGSYQTLEFYGDGMLDSIVISYLMNNFGLNISPGELTRFKTNVVKNDTLTNISLGSGICRIITSTSVMKKHNICSDTFEAIIGALYVQYGYYKFKEISDWLFSITELKEIVENLWIEQLENSRSLQIESNFDSMVLSKKYRNDEDLLFGFLKDYAEKYNVTYSYEYDEINRFIMTKNNNDLTIMFFSDEEPTEKDIKDAIINLEDYGILLRLPNLKYPRNSNVNNFFREYLKKYPYMRYDRKKLSHKYTGYFLDVTNITREELIDELIWL